MLLGIRTQALILGFQDRKSAKITELREKAAEPPCPRIAAIGSSLQTIYGGALSISYLELLHLLQR